MFKFSFRTIFFALLLTVSGTSLAKSCFQALVNPPMTEGNLQKVFKISRDESVKIIQHISSLSPGDRALARQSLEKMLGHEPLEYTEALLLASVLKPLKATHLLIFNAANDVNLIWTSKRYWGLTEGAVYGARLPAVTFWEKAKAMIGTKSGMVVFQGAAAQLFSAHSVEGAYSGLKRLLGQHKSGFGDIIIEEGYYADGVLIVTSAHLATEAENSHIGQTRAYAGMRLWGRRLVLEPLASVTFAVAGMDIFIGVIKYVVGKTDDARKVSGLC